MSYVNGFGGYYHYPDYPQYRRAQYRVERSVNDGQAEKLERTKKKLNMYRTLMLNLRDSLNIPGTMDEANPQKIADNITEYVESLRNNLLIYETFVDTLKNAADDIPDGKSAVEVPYELINTVIERTRT